jgi:eukaryotic-like serine/threonine-protein kinase
VPNNLDTISHYKVLEKLGSGGMGEVYLAADTRLNRKAALKILPPAFAGERKHLNRFWQEARLAATLNHPNICTVYEINDGETPFIALEYIEGETLAAKIDRKSVELNDVLEIALQIADALDEAHRHGILHRDIKSANIVVNSRGRVKVLDFGLAKTFEAETSEQEITRAKTETGMLVGTVAYMSPEQALGKELDGRTDLWSLGVVLYEMTTGKLPFRGATVAATFDAILHDAPGLPTEFAPDLPPAFEQTILRLLEKDRELRYQTASDLRADLRRFERNSSNSVRRAAANGETGVRAHKTDSGLTKRIVTTRFPDAQIASKKKRRVAGFAVVALATIFLLAAGVWAIRSNLFKPPQVSANFQQTEIERLTNYGKVTEAVISPDGKFMAYAIDDNGSESLWLKQLGTNTKLQLVAPANVSFQGIAVSPDSNWVYYNFWDKRSVGQIYRVPTIAAAAPQKIVHDCMPGVIISPDGKRLAFVRSNSKTFQLSFLTADASNGGDERALVAGKYENIGIVSAAWSPDGEKIAYSSVKPSADGQPQAMINEVAATGDGEPKTIWSHPNTIFGGGLIWLPDGKGFLATIYNQQQSTNQIWQISLASGEMRQITKDFNSYGTLSVTADGNSLVTTQQDFALSVWVAPADNPNAARRVTSGKFEGMGSAWTADNQIVYTSSLSGNFDLWIMNADGSNKRQLTSNAGNNTEPCAFDHGKRIAFVSTRNQNTSQIWQINVETGETSQMTTGAGAFAVVCSFADQMVYAMSIKNAAFPRIWRTSLKGEESLIELKQTLNYRPALSLDGKRLAYVFWNQEENRLQQEILTIATGETAPFSLPITAIRGVNQPPIAFRWTPDGRAISYVGDENEVSNIWTLPLAKGAKPKQITNFDENYILSFDWSPDGRQLAVSRGARTSDAVLMRNAP